jgi:hypothetical protein
MEKLTKNLHKYLQNIFVCKPIGSQSNSDNPIFYFSIRLCGIGEWYISEYDIENKIAY